MKFKLLATILVLLLTVSLHAQIDFGIGLQKELFGVSLNPEIADNATFNVDKVDFSMLLSDHFRIMDYLCEQKCLFPVHQLN